MYFTAGGNEAALGLEDYFQMDGLAYGLVPILTPDRDFMNYGRIDTDELYDKMMNQYVWGRMEEPDVHLDYYNLRTLAVIKFRNNFIRLANALIEEGKREKAVAVLDRCMALAPNNKVPYDLYISGISYQAEDNSIFHQKGIVELYFRCNEKEKAMTILNEHVGILNQTVTYYNSLKPKFQKRIVEEYYQAEASLQELERLRGEYGVNETK
jgi:tetratricopeptide (TPR) repeat protein